MRGSSRSYWFALLIGLPAQACGLGAVGADLQALAASQHDGAGGSRSTNGDVASDNADIAGYSDVNLCVEPCDDGNLCTDDICLPATGCAHTPNTIACDDGDSCSADDGCVGGKCVGVAMACDDDNVCTTDACAEAKCVHISIGGGCDDDNVCTSGDACSGGVCVPAATIDCDDANVCTVDACAHPGGCSNVATVGDDGGDDGGQADCSDGDACTVEACAGNVCTKSGNVDCDDKNVCTVDSCDPSVGCANASKAADGTACDDGLSCTLGDVCSDGSCGGSDIFGARVLPKVYQRIVNGGVRIGGVTWLAGGQQSTAIAAPEPWLLQVQGAGDGVSAVSVDGLAPKSAFEAIAASTLGGAAVVAIGVGPVNFWNDTVYAAQLSSTGKMLAYAKMTLAGHFEAHGVQATSAGGALIVGRHWSETSSKAAIATVAVGGGSIALMANALPASSLLAIADHPRGGLAVGRAMMVQDTPISAVVDTKGRIASWRALTETGKGQANAVAALGDGRLLAAGRWAATGEPTPAWWVLDATGRALSRHSGTKAGEVLGLAAATAGGAALLVLGKSGAPSVWILDDTREVVATTTPLGAAVAAGTLVAGTGGWLAATSGAADGGSALATQAQVAVVHRFGAASCAAAGACADADDGSCDDGNACTTDSCAPAKGCSHVANALPCADGEGCVTGAVCAAGSCSGGKPRLFTLTETVDQASADYAPLLAARPDGGATVFLRGASATQTSSVDLLRISANGTFVWSASVKEGQVSSLATLGDAVILAGSKQEGADIWPWLQRRGANGSIEWSHFPTKSKQLNGFTTAVAVATSNRVLAVGTVQGNPNGTSPYVGLAMMLDDNGNTVVLNAIAPPKNTASRQFFDIVPTDRVGGAVIAGVDHTVAGAKLVLVGVQGMSKTLWSYQYGDVFLENNSLLWPNIARRDYGKFSVLTQTGADGYALSFYEAGGLPVAQGVPTSKQKPEPFSRLITLADGAFALFGVSGSNVVLSRFQASVMPTTTTSFEIADAVELAAAATVLTSQDVLVVAQAVLKNGKRTVTIRRMTPEGHATCTEAGLCGVTAAPTCQTGLPCRSAVCDPIAGCGGGPIVAQTCSGGPCSGPGFCDKNSMCNDGDLPSAKCDDGEACTLDACVLGVGCVHKPVADATACDDGDACSKSDACKAGVCTAGATTGC